MASTTGMTIWSRCRARTSFSYWPLHSMYDPWWERHRLGDDVPGLLDEAADVAPADVQEHADDQQPVLAADHGRAAHRPDLRQLPQGHLRAVRGRHQARWPAPRDWRGTAAHSARARGSAGALRWSASGSSRPRPSR